VAESPAHRFGQIIGEVLEASVTPLLMAFSEKHGLYLDKQGERPCRPGKRCTWLDLNKNKHDLDFVLERGGSAEKVGIPAAFIETAWRRYTKHSRNKAQEIQGAIEPLAATYKNARPFIGVILAGVFTEGALNQLRSLGFAVLAAFKVHGIDAFFDEGTADNDFQAKVEAYEALSVKARANLASKLKQKQKPDVKEFMATLKKVVSRQIERITVLPLYGNPTELKTVKDAIKFLETYKEHAARLPIQRYEIRIRYSNADSIEAVFADRKDAVSFLRTYLPVPIVEIQKTI